MKSGYSHLSEPPPTDLLLVEPLPLLSLKTSLMDKNN